jgi:hypothetical protein
MARNILALLFFGSCRLSSSRHNTRAFPRRPQSLFLRAAAKSLHRFSANDFHFQSAKFRKPPIPRVLGISTMVRTFQKSNQRTKLKLPEHVALVIFTILLSSSRRRWYYVCQ